MFYYQFTLSLLHLFFTVFQMSSNQNYSSSISLHFHCLYCINFFSFSSFFLQINMVLPQHLFIFIIFTASIFYCLSSFFLIIFSFYFFSIEFYILTLFSIIMNRLSLNETIKLYAYLNNNSLYLWKKRLNITQRYI